MTKLKKKKEFRRVTCVQAPCTGRKALKERFHSTPALMEPVSNLSCLSQAALRGSRGRSRTRGSWLSGPNWP
jgi:hypothetical protein